jgi:hypothetical protein
VLDKSGVHAATVRCLTPGDRLGAVIPQGTAAEGWETGDIIERQKDRETGKWKYLVRGQTIEGIYIIFVTKLSPTGKMVIITVFSED